MPKILLVEDDNNLREIYGERLMAEGYSIVSAADGEQALSIAVKEKPDLVISDVMMPKISGFDMLDILRQTPETKDIKVIMMTALSQTEDKERAEKLGIDKYLVKSQVTLEDVARVVHDILYPPVPIISEEATNFVNAPIIEESNIIQEEPMSSNTSESKQTTESFNTNSSINHENISTINNNLSYTDTEKNNLTNTELSPDFSSKSEDIQDQPETIISQTTENIIKPDVPIEESSEMSAPNVNDHAEVIPESDISIVNPSEAKFPEIDEESTFTEKFSFPDLSARPSESEEEITDLQPNNSIVPDEEIIKEKTTIEPISTEPDLDGVNPSGIDMNTIQQEETEINNQINNFVNHTPREDLYNKQQRPFVTQPTATRTDEHVPEQPIQSPQYNNVDNPTSKISQETDNQNSKNMQNTSSSVTNNAANQHFESSIPESPSSRKKVIAPLHDPSDDQPNINALFEQEMAEEAKESSQQLQNPLQSSPNIPTQPLQTIDVNQIKGATTATEPQFDDNATPQPTPEETQASSSQNIANDPTHIAL